MRSYCIIRLEPKDYEKCGNIWDMAENPVMARKFFDDLLSGNRMIFVYTENGEFIGEGSLVFESGDPDYTIPGKRIYLSRMIVKEEFRNRGIGGIILDHLCECAKSLNYEEISLGVNVDNLNARHLYEKKDFTDIIYHGKDEYGEYVKLLKKL